MSIISQMWERVSRSDSFVPTRINFKPEQVEGGERLYEAFERDRHYFTVRVNEMFLRYDRHWFNNFDPMVLSICEFLYDGKRETVPYTVGPSLLEKHVNRLPKGMIFSNTRVAGIHPYKGDRLGLGIILFQVKREDGVMNRLFKLIEEISKSIDFASELQSYLQIGQVIISGLESMLDIGDAKPIIGLRNEFDPDAGDDFKPGYFALINAAEASLDTHAFWIKDNQLCQGNNLQEAQPYRENDYVLYSIMPSRERGDIEALPFSRLWYEIQGYPRQWRKFGEDERIFLRGKMFELYHTVTNSPNLTSEHAEYIFDQYDKRKEEIISRYSKLSIDDKGTPRGTDDDQDPRFNKALSILKG